MNKKYLVDKLTAYLEDMCAYHAIGNVQLSQYSAGRADAIRTVLEDFYDWDERNANEHIKNMIEIMEEEL